MLLPFCPKPYEQDLAALFCILLVDGKRGISLEDLFNEVAVDYDKMFPRDFAEDGRIIKGLFRGHKVKTVLDCACGTGPHVAMLARDGYQVTGSDYSAAMLEQARQRLVALDLDATLVESEWATLPSIIDGRFDAVICIGNSLPLAGSDEQVFAAIAGMYKMVNDGGLLVIQNRNMDKMDRERPEAVLNEGAEKGTFTLFVFDYRDPIVIYKIFYIDTAGNEEVLYNQFPMNILTRPKLEKMLKRAGAVSWRFYGDSFFSNFSASRSPRMIVKVEKPMRAKA
jgi:glycine/sarcosine N-methyltransferase